MLNSWIMRWIALSNMLNTVVDTGLCSDDYVWDVMITSETSWLRHDYVMVTSWLRHDDVWDVMVTSGMSCYKVEEL